MIEEGFSWSEYVEEKEREAGELSSGERRRGEEFWKNNEQIIKEYRNDLGLYLREEMGLDFKDYWQVEGFQHFEQSVQKGNLYHFYNFKACAGVGKTTLACCLLLWVMTCFRDGEKYPYSVVITDSKKRFEKATWKTMTKWYNRSRLAKGLFKWTGASLYAYEEPSEWRVTTDLQPRGSDPQEIVSIFNGVHGENIFFFFDESGELSPALKRGFYQLRTSRDLENLFIFSIGNPRFVNSLLYSLDKDPKFVNRSITGDPESPKCSTRIVKSSNREAIAEYGREDPWVQWAILGNFPSKSEDTIFPMDLVEGFMSRKVAVSGGGGEYITIMGVDISEAGTDKSYAVVRRGFQILAIREIQHHAIRNRVWWKKVAEEIEAIAREFNASQINFDGTGGYASACVEHLFEKFDVESFKFNEKGIAGDEYINFRAEIIYRTKHWLEYGEPILLEGPNDKLKEQMTNTVKNTDNEKMTQVVDKKIIKANLGYSPDELDALCLTFARCQTMLAHQFMKTEHDLGESEFMKQWQRQTGVQQVSMNDPRFWGRREGEGGSVMDEYQETVKQAKNTLGF